MLGSLRHGAVAAVRRQRQNVVVRQSVQAAWARGFSDAAEAPKEVSPAVAKIVDDIVALNLLEVSELVEQLNTRLNLPDMPAGGMMMPMGAMPATGGAASADAAEEAAPVEEIKPIVNIQLDSFDASGKIKIIKEVKNLAGLGLKEAKAAVEGAPGVIMSDIKREEAEEIIKTLEGLGAKASMV
ncbi:39S ribosomal protein L12, mitochondrial [Hondaea fermentalgiana]|uniref:39S ribosomal protein L12, mitochondrial n=1 Tax=Hondaea fermentalgiana TaxID=2315210 RepID=A0A2R5GJA5_9STRA|nr:39S ribosomal protein L12, mitochondrial [Hondaea fermentalgiana]|eukprot:GBG30399.1 39S ribosomal protein L12, mitochondrial [Hondaea fermentalgiana]